jgi:hypoxanthine phosphoribosyltransferase
MPQWAGVRKDASGSSKINAKLFVPDVILSCAKGGKIFSTSQVYLAGIGCP